MKEKVYAFFFAVMIAVIGYIIVSSAAAHTALDNAKLHEFHMEFHCVH